MSLEHPCDAVPRTRRRRSRFASVCHANRYPVRSLIRNIYLHGVHDVFSRMNRRDERCRRARSRENE